MIALTAIGFSGIVNADVIPVTNPSFETGDPSTSTFAGWTKGIGGGYENSGSYIGDGNTSADRYEILIGRFGNATKQPFWTQNTSFTPTVAGTTYILTVDVATANALGSIARIELYGTTSSTIYAWNEFTPLATNKWYETAANYLSDGTEGEALGIRLKFGVTSTGANDRIEFNNVRLDSEVPEPNSLALLGLGGLLLARRRHN